MVNRDSEARRVRGIMSEAVRNNPLMSTDVSTSVRQNFRIRRMLKEIGGYDLLIGVPSEDTVRQDDEPFTNAELVYIHTHGIDQRTMRRSRNNVSNSAHSQYENANTNNLAQELYRASMGSPAGNLPPRPIIEPALEANMSEIEKRLKGAIDAFLQGNEEAGATKLKNIGMYCQNVVRKWFTDDRNNWVPLSPYTKRMKAKRGKSKDNPLIDTGEMRKSITYVLISPNRSGRTVGSGE